VSRDAAIYGVAALITQGTALLAVPVYSRVLGPAGFGVIELLIVGLQLLTMVAIAGLETAAIRLYFTADDQPSRRRLLSTGLIAVLVSGVVVGLVVLLSRDAIDRWYLPAYDARDAVVVGAISLPLYVGARYAREALRAQRRPAAYLVNSATAGVLQVAVGVALIAWFDFGPEGVMIGYFAAAAVTLVMSIGVARRLFHVEFSTLDFRALWSFGVPLVWSGLAGWSLMFVDRLVLSASAGVDEVGVYALASRLGMALTLVVYAFTRAWTPAMLELAERDDVEERRTRIRVLNPFLAGIGAVAVAISLLADPLVRLIAGAEFAEAAGLVPIISMGFVVFALVPVIQMPMLIEQRTRPLAVGSIVAALVNLGANLVLVPRYGAAAAAWSTLLAMAVQSGLYWWAAERIQPTPYAASRTVRVLLVTAAFCALGWVAFPAGFVGVAARTLTALAFPAALLVTRAISYRASRDAMRPLVARFTSSLRRT
jgi:O-antigen/teichoic acid export membrane protein